jgi:hypothetical protein
MRFGNPQCDLCGQVHPTSFDCAAAATEEEMGIRKMVDDLIKGAGAIPLVDRTQRVLTDGSPVTPDHKEIQPSGMQKGYVVLSDAERARGFVQPVRRTYVHQKCGVATTMGLALAETYARDPKFYSGTYCCGCGTHFTFGQPDGDFVWDDGSKVGV